MAELLAGRFATILADQAIELGKAAEHLVCADLIRYPNAEPPR